MSPPQLDHGSPPVVVDDAMPEIFLRIPPDDPASLARASAVCTAWRGIISDADFGREYRAFHGAPPVLGFVHNSWNTSASHFTSTTASLCSPACHDREDWYALDSRHGLALFCADQHGYEIRDFAVCDLVTHDWWNVPPPRSPEWLQVEYYWKAAVLCAKVDRCDCEDGAFLVALVGSDDMVIHASVYSSEAGEWSDTTSIQSPFFFMDIDHTGRSAIVGNKAYLPCVDTHPVQAQPRELNLIVEYDMGAQELAVIRAPFFDEPGIALVGAEDGMLLFAAAEESVVYIWSMEPGPNGAARRRVIDLEPLLPRLALCSLVSVAGFAEGPGAIFVSTDEGLFTVELSSCRSKKVHGESIDEVMPYESFYTGGHGGRGRRAVLGATRRWAGLLWLYGESLQ